MWYPPRALPALLTIITAASLMGVSAGSKTTRTPHSTHDSVTVRVTFKSWEGEMDCSGMNWGWDSLTWRLSPGQQIPHAFMFDAPEFQLGRRVSDRSAWLLYRAQHVALSKHRPNGPDLDSLLISTDWSAMFTTVGVFDAQMWFRVRLVEPWPESAPPIVGTTTLRGKIVDDSTGCAVIFCQVMVDGTRVGSYTDTLGYFVLNDVPLGRVGLDACSGTYISGHLEVVVPSEPVVLRLRRDPRVKVIGARPCR